MNIVRRIIDELQSPLTRRDLLGQPRGPKAMAKRKRPLTRSGGWITNFRPYAVIISNIMKALPVLILVFLTTVASLAQDHAKQIYDTERAFERAVAEKGIKAGFIEYLSPLGVMFRPEAVNGREWWKSRPESPAALTWNPIKIEVSSNGALAYSIGNSIYKPKGSTDTAEFYGHYITVWTRQTDGSYRAALDAGIDHPRPSAPEPTWSTGTAAAVVENKNNSFAGDSSIGFFQMAESRGLGKAYKAYAADDVIFMREGKLPFFGRGAAGDAVGEDKLAIKFVKRRSFIEAGDLAYVYSTYARHDKDGTEKEKGNFVQVWKLRGGKWLIVADIFIVIPPPKN